MTEPKKKPLPVGYILDLAEMLLNHAHPHWIEYGFDIMDDDEARSLPTEMRQAWRLYQTMKAIEAHMECPKVDGGDGGGSLTLWLLEGMDTDDPQVRFPNAYKSGRLHATTDRFEIRAGLLGKSPQQTAEMPDGLVLSSLTDIVNRSFKHGATVYLDVQRLIRTISGWDYVGITVQAHDQPAVLQLWTEGDMVEPLLDDQQPPAFGLAILNPTDPMRAPDNEVTKEVFTQLYNKLKSQEETS